MSFGKWHRKTKGVLSPVRERYPNKSKYELLGGEGVCPVCLVESTNVRDWEGGSCFSTGIPEEFHREAACYFYEEIYAEYHPRYDEWSPSFVTTWEEEVANKVLAYYSNEEQRTILRRRLYDFPRYSFSYYNFTFVASGAEAEMGSKAADGSQEERDKLDLVLLIIKKRLEEEVRQ